MLGCAEQFNRVEPDPVHVFEFFYDHDELSHMAPFPPHSVIKGKTDPLLFVFSMLVALK